MITTSAINNYAIQHSKRNRWMTDEARIRHVIECYIYCAFIVIICNYIYYGKCFEAPCF